MRVTSKGQVTIPMKFREELGLTAGSVVDFFLDGDAVQVKKSAPDRQDLGRRLIEDLRGRGDVEMSTDQIMALTRES